MSMAEISGSHYTGWKIVNLLFGIALIGVIVSYILRIRKTGVLVQKSLFFFMFIAATTFLLHGVDPNGYCGNISLKASNIFHAISQASLYTCCFIMILPWNSLLCGDKWNVARLLRALAFLVQIAVWIVLIAMAVAISSDPLDDVHALYGLQNAVLAVLSMMAIAYFVYIALTFELRLETAENSASNSPSSQRLRDGLHSSLIGLRTESVEMARGSRRFGNFSPVPLFHNKSDMIPADDPVPIRVVARTVGSPEDLEDGKIPGQSGFVTLKAGPASQQGDKGSRTSPDSYAVSTPSVVQEVDRGEFSSSTRGSAARPACLENLSSWLSTLPMVQKWQGLPPVIQFTNLLVFAMIILITFHLMNAIQALSSGYLTAWQALNVCLAESKPTPATVKDSPCRASYENESEAIVQLIFLVILCWISHPRPETSGKTSVEALRAREQQVLIDDLMVNCESRLDSVMSSCNTPFPYESKYASVNSPVRPPLPRL